MIEAVVSEDELAVAHALESIITWLRASRQSEELSASALSVLSRLDTVGAMRITDLAEREGLSQPGTTTLVNRLVAADYARRNNDPTDGRVVLVDITLDGTARLHAYRRARAELVASRLRQLHVGDREALLAALPALTHFVDA